MKTSKKGIDIIKTNEGCILYSYDDLTGRKVEKNGNCTGTLTIGYGHTGNDVKKGMSISSKKAEELLKKDLLRFEDEVDWYQEKYSLNQNQYDALVSFAFNCGIGALGSVMRQEDPTEKMLLYVNSKGHKLNGLVRRRQTEVDLYNTPVLSTYYEACYKKETSIVDALHSIGVDGTYKKRLAIAKKNGIKLYRGSAAQNTKMLSLLKDGKLKKA